MPQLKDYATSVAILVSSCDAFFDAWKPFAAFLEIFWKDCPLPIHLITNRLAVRSARIIAQSVGPDRGWSSNLQCALEKIPQPYVLYLQEDYFLIGPVQTEALAMDLARVIESGADSLCFRNRRDSLRAKSGDAWTRYTAKDRASRLTN